MTLSGAQSKRIIVLAVDETEKSEYTFDYYCDHIQKEGDKLVLVHVPEDSFFLVGAEAKVRQLKEGANKISALEKSFVDKMHLKRIEGTFRVGVGKPGQVILRVAQEENANLVMVGGGGQSKSHFSTIGSVCKFVVHNSTMPVLVCQKEQSSKMSTSSTTI